MSDGPDVTGAGELPSAFISQIRVTPARALSKTIFEPSGVQLGRASTPSPSESGFCACGAATSTVQIPGCEPFLSYATFVPSGDQEQRRSSGPNWVSGVSPVPSTLMTKMS